MEIYALFHPYVELFCALIILILSVFVISRNPEDITSKTYSLFLFPLAIASIFEFIVRIGASEQLANAFNRPKFLLLALGFCGFIYFTLALTEKHKALRSPLTHLLVFLPMPFLAYIYLFSKATLAGYLYEPYGRITNPAGLYLQLTHGQMALYMGIGMIIVIAYSLKTKHRILKIRGLVFTFASLIPWITIPLTLIVLPKGFGIKTPPLLVPSICAATLLTFYAVKRYSLFAITPAKAADAIMDTSSSSILAIDSQSKISFANQSACSLLGKKASAIQDQTCNSFFDKAVCQLISERLLSQGNSIKNYETSITLASGERRTIILNGVILKDRFGTNIGAVIDLKDITHKKEAEEQIKRKYQELEKINKFLLGRELDMADLKKEVNNLLVEQNKEPKYTV